MSDHCHINFGIEIYDKFEMSNNGDGDKIKSRIEEQIHKIMANEGFFDYQYFISGSVS